MGKSTTYGAAAVAMIGGFLQGYITCVIAGALFFMVKEFDLNSLHEGWAASAVLLGALFGSSSSGYLADKLGRRISIQISACLFFISGVSALFTDSFFTLLVIRLISGFGVGMASILGPLYLSEIAPASQRGAFVTGFILASAIGTLVAYLVNYLLTSSGNWRLMLGLSAVPAGIQFLTFFFFPKSPKMPQLEELKISSKWRDLLSPTTRFVLFLGIALCIFQQLSGVNAIVYFTPKIFKEAGFIEQKQAVFPTLFIGVINVFSVSISMFLIDRIGRKKILLISQFGIIATLFFIALAFATENIYLDYLAVIALTGYIGAYALGMGPIVWVIVAEIYPLAIRAKAMAVMTFLSWLMNYLIVLTFPPFASKAGCSTPFFVYALLSACAFFIFLRYLPETKGKTLEELEKLLIHR